MSTPTDYILQVALAHVKQFVEGLKPQPSTPVPEIHLVTYASCSHPEHPIHIELNLDRIALVGTLNENEQLTINVPASVELSLNSQFRLKQLPAHAVVDTLENLKKNYGVEEVPEGQMLNGLFKNYVGLDLDPDPLDGYALAILIDTGPAQQPTQTQPSTEERPEPTTGMYL